MRIRIFPDSWILYKGSPNTPLYQVKVSCYFSHLMCFLFKPSCLRFFPMKTHFLHTTVNAQRVIIQSSAVTASLITLGINLQRVSGGWWFAACIKEYIQPCVRWDDSDQTQANKTQVCPFIWMGVVCFGFSGTGCQKTQQPATQKFQLSEKCSPTSHSDRSNLHSRAWNVSETET